VRLKKKLIVIKPNASEGSRLEGHFVQLLAPNVWGGSLSKVWTCFPNAYTSCCRGYAIATTTCEQKAAKLKRKKHHKKRSIQVTSMQIEVRELSLAETPSVLSLLRRQWLPPSINARFTSPLRRF